MWMLYTLFVDPRVVNPTRLVLRRGWNRRFVTCDLSVWGQCLNPTGRLCPGAALCWWACLRPPRLCSDVRRQAPLWLSLSGSKRGSPSASGAAISLLTFWRWIITRTPGEDGMKSLPIINQEIKYLENCCCIDRRYQADWWNMCLRANIRLV